MAYNPLSSHQIRKSLKTLRALSDNERLSGSNAALSEENHWQLERVFYFADEVEQVLSGLRPIEFNVIAANAVSNALVAARDQLQNFISNGNVGHLNNAANQIDAHGEPHLRDMLPAGVKVHPRTASALEAYKRRAVAAKSELSKDIENKKKTIDELQQRLDQGDIRLQELQAEVESMKTASGTLLEQFRSENERFFESSGSRFEDFLTDHKDKAQMIRNDVVSDYETLMGELEQKREDASKIVQSVGDVLTTATYSDRAKSELDKADLYRWITIGLFVFGLIIIVSNYLIFFAGQLAGTDFDLAESWPMLLARLATGIAVALPAIYTAKESARHRTNADLAKQRELELSTLGPFIELLPSEKKTEIRDRLTDRYFGQSLEPHEVEHPMDVEKLAKLADAMAKLVPKS